MTLALPHIARINNSPRTCEVCGTRMARKVIGHVSEFYDCVCHRARWVGLVTNIHFRGIRYTAEAIHDYRS